MGIPGLTTRLSTYATSFTPEELAGYQAIVDGPSLAYHAHELAVKAALHNKAPSYADVNHKAISWLRSLERLDMTVIAILFDGALPPTKKSERMLRMNDKIRASRSLRLQHPTAASFEPTVLGTASYPLLAPALREALAQTEFSPVTRIVPGEADDYCALSAKNAARRILFSNDSDLLLYDYPAETLVVFLRDVELHPQPSFRGYSPPKICQELKLQSLVPFAYSIMQDRWMALNACLEQSERLDDDTSDKYLSFRSRYLLSANLVSQCNPITEVHATPQYLDVRVSEFVHEVFEAVAVPEIYLPVLVEDVNCSSAWNTGEDIRRLAYSLIAPGTLSMKEYTRKAQLVTGHILALLPAEEIVAATAAVTSDLCACLRSIADRTNDEGLVWSLIASKFALPGLSTTPRISLMCHVLQDDFHGSWNFIQLTASMQAASYSLRILKQCAQFWLQDCSNEVSQIRSQIRGLEQSLRRMPSIADMFLVLGQQTESKTDSHVLRDLIGDIYISAGVAIPKEHKSSKKSQSSDKKLKAKKGRSEVSSGTRSNNIFDTLPPG